eukprot:COSAG03_NODE_7660_length_887_cov_2.899746_1_plen_25_part_10
MAVLRSRGAIDGSAALVRRDRGVLP